MFVHGDKNYPDNMRMNGFDSPKNSLQISEFEEGGGGGGGRTDGGVGKVFFEGAGGVGVVLFWGLAFDV